MFPCSVIIDLRWIFQYYRIRFDNALDLLERVSVEFRGIDGFVVSHVLIIVSVVFEWAGPFRLMRTQDCIEALTEHSETVVSIRQLVDSPVQDGRRESVSRDGHDGLHAGKKFLRG